MVETKSDCGITVEATVNSASQTVTQTVTPRTTAKPVFENLPSVKRLDYSVALLETIEPAYNEGFRYKVIHLPTRTIIGHYKTNVEASEIVDALN